MNWGILLAFIVIVFSRFPFQFVIDSPGKGHYQFDWYAEILTIKWTALALIFICYFSWWVYKKSHWSLGLFLLNTLLSGAYICLWEYNQFIPIASFNNIIQMRFEVMQYLFLIIGIFWICFNIDISLKIKILRGLIYLTVLNSAFVLSELIYMPGAFYCGGIWGNSSMNACSIAVMYPFILEHRFNKNYYINMLIKLLPVVAVMLTKSSMAYATLFVVCVIYSLTINKISIKTAKKIIISALISITLIYTFSEKNLFSSSGRFEIWRFQIKKTLPETCNIVTGCGTGTFNVIGKSAQLFSGLLKQKVYKNYKQPLWPTMHNEFLQIVFENGIIGGILVITLIMMACIKAWKYPALLTSFLGYITFSLGNWPLHMAYTAFLGVFLLSVIFAENLSKKIISSSWRHR